MTKSDKIEEILKPVSDDKYLYGPIKRKLQGLNSIGLDNIMGYISRGMNVKSLMAVDSLTKFMNIMNALDASEFPILDFNKTISGVPFEDHERQRTIALMSEYLDSSSDLNMFKYYDGCQDHKSFKYAIQLKNMDLDYGEVLRMSYWEARRFSSAYIRCKDKQLAHALVQSDYSGNSGLDSFLTLYEESGRKYELRDILVNNSYGNLRDIMKLIKSNQLFNMSRDEIIDAMYRLDFEYDSKSLQVKRYTGKLIQRTREFNAYYNYYLELGIPEKVVRYIKQSSASYEQKKAILTLLELGAYHKINVMGYVQFIEQMSMDVVKAIYSGVNMSDYLGMNLSTSELDNVLEEIFRTRYVRSFPNKLLAPKLTWGGLY